AMSTPLQVKKMMPVKRIIVLFLALCLMLTAAPLCLADGPVSHMPYMTGYGGDRFGPDEHLTRAHFSQILYNFLLSGERGKSSPKTPGSLFSDVSSSDWFCSAIEEMAGRGAFKGYTDGRFKPHKNITKAEFVLVLTRLYGKVEGGNPAFAKDTANNWAAEYLASANAKGWIKANGIGYFYPDAAITRAEAVTILNRALGRNPDKGTIDKSADDLGIYPVFTDVPKSHPAYYEIVEATVRHSCNISNGQESWTDWGRTPGLHYKDCQLYGVDSNGMLMRNTACEGRYFDGEGRQSTGNAELDKQITDALNKCTKPGISSEDRLKAAYNYVAKTFVYGPRSTGDNVKEYSSGWVADCASEMFSRGWGDCYRFAAAFCVLAQRLGYDAVAHSGYLYDAPHGFVTIRGSDGVDYIYDPEMNYAKGFEDLKLYHTVNYQYYQYIYKWHSSADELRAQMAKWGRPSEGTSTPSSFDAEKYDRAQVCIGYNVTSLFNEIGKPKSMDYSSSCLVIGAQDGSLEYDGFIVCTIKESSGYEYVYAVYKL
ncbi:MAG: S-layer homology domain-containing protein, partial [Oscillospiraceae bacterium]|nr:S-layer homology domain-containing protein [Oscillospiraceae bacterium]